MSDSAFARMGFAGYTAGSLACVLKDLPVVERPPVSASAAEDFITVEQFSQLSALLYEAALDPQAWKDFLAALRKQLGGNFASLIVRPGNGDDVGLIISAAADRQEFLSGSTNIGLSPLRDLATDRITTLGDLVPENEWRNSRYYLDWCRDLGVFHVLAADVVTKDGCVYGLRVTRPESMPNFGPREREFGTMLLPHIKRALNLHLSMNQDRQVISLYSRAMAQLMVGVIILDQNGQVIESNPAASSILEQQDGLKVSGGMLEATYANDNRKLQRLIKDALLHTRVSRLSMTEGMAISRQSGQLNWGVVVQSMSADEWTEGKQRPSVAVFVRDTSGKADPPVKLAQQLFQLTPAETALAIQLANGLSLEETAELLNIRRNTARAHLRSIFSKTGVRRQTELVRIFLNSVAWLGDK
ncbi:DNA-binding transcriptional regulator, CsgD family [Oryzisolibacter propanilivorax]|uniref:DNA-binding transcriptional regulator, CsgD family n=1 Tax=Oryzisolibacter propanilivorax TaxID=1527607 RepID=A0A1G9NXK9_9BURK|nr:DNA-binding transcriptional regulator, CsgD family [Oryzisolibacter propanilivorax]